MKLKKRVLLIKKYHLYLVPPLVVLSALIIIQLLNPPFDLSGNEIAKQVISNSDKSSTVQVIDSSSALFEMKYRVGTTVNPYAGGGFTLEKYLDLRSFETLELTLDSYNSNDCALIFTDFIAGFSVKDHIPTHRNWLYDLSVKKGTSRYRIPLKKFATPSWWYKEAKISEDDIPHKQGKKGQISSILFYNHPTAETNVDLHIVVQSIRFTHDFSLMWILFGVCSILYFLFYGIFVLFVFGNQSELQYKQVEIPDATPSEDLPKLFEFLHENYADSALNMNVIQMKTGLSEPRIRKLLSEGTEKNLRQYINKIRITEACRLLRETKLQVKEIAFSVGYRHISSFNRSFVEQEHISPAEYRQHHA